jgi:hypothetical protein
VEESWLRIINNFGMLIAAIGLKKFRISNRVKVETTGIQEEWIMSPK